MKLEDFANRASNILCGHGGASEEEMLRRMEVLVERERELGLYRHGRAIAKAIKQAARDIDRALEDATRE